MKKFYITILIAIYGCNLQKNHLSSEKCVLQKNEFNVSVDLDNPNMFKPELLMLGELVMKLRILSCDITEKGYDIKGEVYNPQAVPEKYKESGVSLTYCIEADENKWKGKMLLGKTDDQGVFFIKIPGHSKFGIVLSKDNMTKRLYTFE